MNETNCATRDRVTKLKLPTGRLATDIAFSYTLNCNARCAHCGVNGGPKRRGKLGVEKTIAAIKVAAQAGIKVAGFTGGEPLLYTDDLTTIMQTCHDAYGTVFSLTTNGYWAFSAKAARSLVDRLASAGLIKLRMSADAYHQEFVPLERVIMAVEAGLARGIKVRVDGVVGLNDRETAKIFSVLRKYPIALGMQPLLPAGRAAEVLSSEKFPTTSSHTARFSGCVQAGMPLVTHEGEVFRCCNFLSRPDEGGARTSLYYLGRLDSDGLPSILARNEASTLSRILRQGGPHLLRSFVEQLVPQARLAVAERYMSLCDYCQSLVLPSASRSAILEAIRIYDQSASAPPPAIIHEVAAAL